MQTVESPNNQNYQVNTAHTLYALYETLPQSVQRDFLTELLEKQTRQLEDLLFYLACKQAQDENDFVTDEQANDFINSLPQ
jgi:hypothetical protein